jgi:hypothetical protein
MTPEITDAVKYRAAELLARRRGNNPNSGDAVFQALGEISRVLEVLEAIHAAVEEAEA